MESSPILFDIISDAVILLDTDAVIQDANVAATEVLGYSRAELIGRRPSLWQRPEEAGQRAAEVTSALASHGQWKGEYTIVRRDGSNGTVDSRVRMVQETAGRPAQTIAILRDVSDQRRLEVQLFQAQKLKAVGSLGAGVAHEINTPLQYVTDNIQFLDDGLRGLRSIVAHGEAIVAATQHEPALQPLIVAFTTAVSDADLRYLDMQLPDAANHAREGCARVREIVRALTRFAVPATVGRTLTDVNACIRDVLTVSRNDWKLIATVTTDLDPALPHIFCVTAEINQVLLNVVLNAAQAIASVRGAAQPMGRVTIATRKDADWVTITIADDGPGIPAENQSRIFDPFFSTREPGQGIGHGLSSAHASIVGNHRGQITVESCEGHGATFTIRLPLVCAETQGFVS